MYIPLKVKIGLRPNGHADHPDWSKLPMVGTQNPEQFWAMGGWKYDKTSGHREDTPDSPVGFQYGMILVTPQFATEAIAEFPALIQVLTEAECQSFWDDKAHAHLEDSLINIEALNALNVEHQLLVATNQSTGVLDVRIRRALDEDNPSPGKRKNYTKKWVDAKERSGITIGVLP